MTDTLKQEIARALEPHCYIGQSELDLATAALSVVQPRIERLEGLIARAQINGDRLPQAWHDDARAALAHKETKA